MYIFFRIIMKRCFPLPGTRRRRQPPNLYLWDVGCDLSGSDYTHGTEDGEAWPS